MKNLGKFIVSAVVGISFVGGASAAADPDRSTPEQTVAFVKKAQAFLAANTCDAALAEFSNQAGQFRERELFAIVMDKDAKVVAHTALARMIGKNIMDLKDGNGVDVVKPWFAGAKSKKEGWGVEYTFINPKSKNMEPKNTYWELVPGEKCGIYMIAAGRHFLK